MILTKSFQFLLKKILFAKIKIFLSMKFEFYTSPSLYVNLEGSQLISNCHIWKQNDERAVF